MQRSWSGRGGLVAPPLPPLALLAGRHRGGRRAGTVVTAGARVLPFRVVRARRGRAHELLVAGVVVDVPLQPGDHGRALVVRVAGGRRPSSGPRPPGASRRGGWPPSCSGRGSRGPPGSGRRGSAGSPTGCWCR